MADARETDSPTPPLHNHVMNNVDLSKEDAKEKNSHGYEENHVTGKMDGSTARQVFHGEGCMLLCAWSPTFIWIYRK